MQFDVSHVDDLSRLLNLVKEAAGHPNLKAIGDAAMAELNKYAAELGKVAEEVKSVVEPTEETDESGT